MDRGLGHEKKERNNILLDTVISFFFLKKALTDDLN